MLKGTYLLLISLNQATQTRVGRLGILSLPAGWYAYAGSALGPGGLAARLARHRRQEKRLHWHIDYLLAVSALKAVWHIASPERLECAWASAIARLHGSQIRTPRFGSSDCTCPSHLVHLPYCPTTQQIRHALARVSPHATSDLVHTIIA